MLIPKLKIKHSSLILSMLLCVSPQVTADPWSWLDKPEKQYWSNITIDGYGRQINFAIPDKAKRFGSHVKRLPRLEKGQRDQVIEVPLDYVEHPANRIVKFVWEHYWGGFFKENTIDFNLKVSIGFVGKKARLLDVGHKGRVDRVKKEFADLYKQSGSKDGAEWFFERFRMEPYESAQSYEWTWENSPTIVKEHDFFRLPITQNHELIFWFYYRQELQGGRDDPAWLERRKQLARKILDTVRITPDPFKLSGELSEIE